jgi:NAD-dependent deacetylase
MKQKIVVLTGAGISAESGIQTFRGAGGLWNGYNVMEVASIDGWHKNPKLVLDFYNLRRADAANAQPNLAHTELACLEQKYDVTIITQNVDDLHERGGSTKVIHLHGKLREARSTQNDKLVYDIGDKPIDLGDICEMGSQLRPNIVWFGEMVPMMEIAAQEVSQADIFMIVGTSLLVYPAASLVHYAPKTAQKYIIDIAPDEREMKRIPNMHVIANKASLGVSQVVEQLMNS